MKVHKLKDTIRGWFVGDFLPSIFKTKECEAAIQYYKAGESEKKHIHKIATEITVLAEGRAIMNGIEYKKGDIIVMEPGDATDFLALTDTINVVIKIPSIPGDKYFV